MLGATAVVLAHAATIKALEKGEEDGHMTRSYLTPCFGGLKWPRQHCSRRWATRRFSCP